MTRGHIAPRVRNPAAVSKPVLWASVSTLTNYTALLLPTLAGDCENWNTRWESARTTLGPSIRTRCLFSVAVIAGRRGLPKTTVFSLVIKYSASIKSLENLKSACPEITLSKSKWAQVLSHKITQALEWQLKFTEPVLCHGGFGKLSCSQGPLYLWQLIFVSSKFLENMPAISSPKTTESIYFLSSRIQSDGWREVLVLGYCAM